MSYRCCQALGTDVRQIRTEKPLNSMAKLCTQFYEEMLGMTVHFPNQQLQRSDS